MKVLALLQKHGALVISVGLTVMLVAAITAIIAIGASEKRAVSQQVQQTDKRLITVYDRGAYTSFMSNAKTLSEALKENDVAIDPEDTVEPSLDEELVAPEYRVNVYRARPVTVIDGETRVKIVTPFQTADSIAKDAGIALYREDTAEVSRSTDFTGDGAGLQLTIKRSIPFILDLYGRKSEVRTQGKTVKAMLEEKHIVLGERGRVSVDEDTIITAGMEVRVWREGVQTISVDEAIPFGKEIIQDADRYVNYRAVSSQGKPGVRTINYEVEIKDGVEISRKEIARMDMQAPVNQVEVIGIKSFPGALSKAKGAQQFTDSKGVTHRETYYDLPMGVVMTACGQGGYYTVRPSDGAKVDREGYVIIAANYGNYPRCSIVETSMGPGKVYDTGGFAARHPHGFDLATDWTRADGI